MTAPITEPGVYQLTAADYHRDPVEGGSLSSTGARRLLEPAGPARFRWALDNPGEDRTDAFDLGTAVHQVALGDPEDRLYVTTAEEWRTKEVKAEVAAAREDGKTVLRPSQWQTVADMAAAVRQHPGARSLLKPGGGKPEQSLVWQDRETGVMCRARIDWLPTYVDGWPFVVTDLKTTEHADGEAFGKSAANFGYHVQAAFYLAGVEALGLGVAPTFRFINVEKRAPYLVNVIELDDVALNVGRNLARIARHTYATCQRTGEWPGYPDDVEVATLPEWYLRDHDEHLEMRVG